MGLRKTGLLVLLYDICMMVVFVYLAFMLGNAGVDRNPVIQDFLNYLSFPLFFSFLLGLLFLPVGAIALIFAKNAGLSVARKGVWLIIAAGALSFISLLMYPIFEFQSIEDKLGGTGIVLLITSIIMIPGWFLLKKVKVKRA